MADIKLTVSPTKERDLVRKLENAARENKAVQIYLHGKARFCKVLSFDLELGPFENQLLQFTLKTVPVSEAAASYIRDEFRKRADREFSDVLSYSAEDIEKRIAGMSESIPESVIVKGRTLKDKYDEERAARGIALAYAYGMGEQRLCDMLKEAYGGTATGRFYPKKGTVMNNWKFKSTHPTDIDFHEIADALTRQNPIALVRGDVFKTVTKTRPKLNPDGSQVKIGRDIIDEFDDGQKITRHIKEPVFEDHTVRVKDSVEAYVVVHPSLYQKSTVAGIVTPTAVLPEKVIGNSTRVYSIDVSEFPKWVQWAKDVKGASWDDDERRRAEFEVTMPNI